MFSLNMFLSEQEIAEILFHEYAGDNRKIPGVFNNVDVHRALTDHFREASRNFLIVHARNLSSNKAAEFDAWSQETAKRVTSRGKNLVTRTGKGVHASLSGGIKNLLCEPIRQRYAEETDKPVTCKRCIKLMPIEIGA